MGVGELSGEMSYKQTRGYKGPTYFLVCLIFLWKSFFVAYLRSSNCRLIVCCLRTVFCKPFFLCIHDVHCCVPGLLASEWDLVGAARVNKTTHHLLYLHAKLSAHSSSVQSQNVPLSLFFPLNQHEASFLRAPPYREIWHWCCYWECIGLTI